jgi:hypothetical protein
VREYVHILHAKSWQAYFKERWHDFFKCEATLFSAENGVDLLQRPSDVKDQRDAGNTNLINIAGVRKLHAVDFHQREVLDGNMSALFINRCSNLVLQL